MANLKPWQVKLTENRLYKVRPKANRNIGLTSITPQGLETDTFSLYVALDGAVADTNPASLNEMSIALKDFFSPKAIESLDFNFLAVTKAAGGSIYLSGFEIEDLGAIA